MGVGLKEVREELAFRGYKQPSSDEGGGPLAVEGGKKCSLYLSLSLDDSMI